MTSAASCHPSWVPIRLVKENTPTGRDFVISELASTRTSRNSFHIPRALMMHTVTITGVDIGTMILAKVLNTEAPSM